MAHVHETAPQSNLVQASWTDIQDGRLSLSLELVQGRKHWIRSTLAS
jgi:hypothetical protein